MTMVAAQSLTVHCKSTFQGNMEFTGGHAGQQDFPMAFFGTLAALQPRMASYWELLGVDEQARAKRFRFDTDRDRFIIGHGLLRALLGRSLNMPPAEIAFLRGEFGKPFLENDPIHFNLSDTKDAVLVAIAHEPIGADIETMNRNTDHLGVADHYFTAAEVESIRTARDGKRRFLELWTRKEAVLKACGVGLMDDLHSLEVGDTLNILTISHPDFVRLAAPEYHVVSMSVGTDHLISLASESAIPGIRLLPA